MEVSQPYLYLLVWAMASNKLLRPHISLPLPIHLQMRRVTSKWSRGQGKLGRKEKVCLVRLRGQAY